MIKEFKIDIIIYPEEIIKETVLVFNEVSEIIYKNELITVNGKNSLEIDEIFNEFMNYNIGLINA